MFNLKYGMQIFEDAFCGNEGSEGVVTEMTGLSQSIGDTKSTEASHNSSEEKSTFVTCMFVICFGKKSCASGFNLVLKIIFLSLIQFCAKCSQTFTGPVSALVDTHRFMIGRLSELSKAIELLEIFWFVKISPLSEDDRLLLKILQIAYQVQ